MTKSELIEKIAAVQTQLSAKDVELAVKMMLDHMAEALADGERIEIRGFGSFSLHYRAPRLGRNPKTGEKVELAGKYVPHFKPGSPFAVAQAKLCPDFTGKDRNEEGLPKARHKRQKCASCQPARIFNQKTGKPHNLENVAGQVR